MEQTYTNLELIVVDDGSSDNTDAVVKSIDDPRITYIKYQENRGANHARNVGINAAKGDFIAFQDSDDQWFPEKLEVHLNAFSEAPPETGVVYTGFYRITGSEKVYIPGEHIRQKEGDILHELLKDNFISTPAVLIKRECFDRIGLFDERLPRLQDWDLFIRLAKACRFKYVDRATYHAYDTPRNISSNQNAKYEALETFISKFKDDYIAKGLYANFCYSVGTWNAKTDKQKARRYLLEALKANRLFWKAYARLFLLMVK